MRVVDALDHEWPFDAPPQRIVSLVPSTTETIFEFGCGDRLAARTDYCIHPDEAARLPSVGGTKNPNLNLIRDLQPDLILANQEENTRATIESLLAEGWCVLVFFPRTVRQSIDDLHTLAMLLGAPRADELLDEIDRAYADRLQQRDRISPLRVFVPIWNHPLMTFNADTFPNDLLSLCGAHNVFADRARRYPLSADRGETPPVDASPRDTRYPRVTPREVIERSLRAVWLPDEPYVFSDAEANAMASALNLPAERIHRVDGSLLFWHGTRLRRALREIPTWCAGDT